MSGSDGARCRSENVTRYGGRSMSASPDEKPFAFEGVDNRTGEEVSFKVYATTRRAAKAQAMDAFDGSLDITSVKGSALIDEEDWRDVSEVL